MCNIDLLFLSIRQISFSTVEKDIFQAVQIGIINENKTHWSPFFDNEDILQEWGAACKFVQGLVNVGLINTAFEYDVVIILELISFYRVISLYTIGVPNNKLMKNLPIRPQIMTIHNGHIPSIKPNKIHSP